MRVEVYADFACAWCRLVIRRFERAVELAGASEVELVHRPFQLAPHAPVQPRPIVEAMAEAVGREQATAMFDGMTQLGAGEGVEYRFDRALEVNTLDAHRLMCSAQRSWPAAALDLGREIYDAHFRDGVNIADHAELVRLAEKAGLDGDSVRELLASAEEAERVRTEVAEARRSGVTAVPTFVFADGERFSGQPTTEELATKIRQSG